MTIALDGHYNNNVAGYKMVPTYGSGLTAHLTTATNGDIIVAVVSTWSVSGATSGGHSENNGYVPLVNFGDNNEAQSGTRGLVWQRRSQIQYSPTSGVYCNVEVWWAYQPTAGRVDVSCQTALVCDKAEIVLFGVSGANTTAPFDPNTSLEQISSVFTGGNPTTASHTYSTSSSANLALAISTNYDYSNQPTSNTGWTNVDFTQDGNGSVYAELCVDYIVNSSAVSGGTASFGWIGSSNLANIYVDAIVASGQTGVTDPIQMQIDGTGAVGTISGGSSGTVTLTTANANDIIVVAVASRNNGSGYKSVSSVAATSGTGTVGTFTQRAGYAPSDDSSAYIEYWWALASTALTSKVLTVTMSGSTAGVAIQAFAITGANTTTPWDTTTPETDQVSNTNAPAFSGLNSAATAGLAIAISMWDYSSGGYNLTSNNAPPGWTEAGASTHLYDGSANVGVYVATQGCNTAASNLGANWTGNVGAYSSASAYFFTVMDFMVSAQYSPPASGSWASTEAKDTFAASGGLVGGTWASTEAKDTFAASGGLLGGTWASTEAKDAMAFIGYPELAGTWASVEAKDIAFFSEIVEGAWASTEAKDTFAASGSLLGGTMGPTEAKDTMSVHGGLLGGTWASTGAKDAMAFIGYPELTGTWASTEGSDTFAGAGHGPLATTWDPSFASAGVDLENMNLTATNTLSYSETVAVRSTNSHSSRKWYAEFSTTLSQNQSGVGIANASATAAGWGNGSTPGLNGAGIYYSGDGQIWINGVQQTNWAGVSIGSAVIGMAIDLDHNLIWFRTNDGQWNGTAWADPTKSPGGLNSSGQDINNGGYDISGISAGGVYLWAELFGGYDQVTMNAGASAFVNAAPSGYTAWESVSQAASPLQIDGYATSGISETSGDSYAPLLSGTVTLTTTQPNDVIVLAVAMGGYYNTAQVASITDTAGLTWHRRNRRWQAGGQKKQSQTVINQGLDIEIWWAHAPAPLVSDVITVNVNSASYINAADSETSGVGAMAILAWGVSGANYTTPWDTHTQAGGYVDPAGGFYTPAASQQYTNAANCLLFGVHGDTGADYGTATSPWTYVASATGTEHNGNTAFASLIYQLVEEPQEAVDVQVNFEYAGSPYGSAQSMMFDAIVAAGEIGTAGEIVWFWDSNNVSGGGSSGCSGVLQLSGSAPNLVLNYSSTNYNLMVLVQVMIQSASGLGEVTSIGESQGLVSSAGFERRSRTVTATPNGTIATEIWWAWMPMHTEKALNDQITIYTSGTAIGDTVSAQMIGLGGSTGAYDLGDPFWDPNPSLPATNSSTSTTPPPNVTDMSTNTLSTLLVAWTANITEAELAFTDPFVSLVQYYPLVIAPTLSFSAAAPPANLGFEYLYSATLALNETAEFILQSPGEPNGWIMIGDAIPVGPPQPPSGTWHSTEAKDTFNHTGDYSFIGIVGTEGWVGFTPIRATWASTDTKDKFTGAPAQAPYDSIGWLGWVPGHGTWASTDTKDHMVFDAWLLGFGPITGQINAYEHKDRFAGSNRATVTGTWASTDAKDRMADSGYLIPLPGPPQGERRRRLLIVT